MRHNSTHCVHASRVARMHNILVGSDGWLGSATNSSFLGSCETFWDRVRLFGVGIISFNPVRCSKMTQGDHKLRGCGQV